MIAIGDGGFTWWVGVLVSVVYIWRRTRSAQVLRGPVMAGVMAGVVAWVIAGGVLALLLCSAPPLPDLLRRHSLGIELNRARKPFVRRARQATVDTPSLLMLNKPRSEEHTSELQSLMRISYAVFCLQKKK